MSCHTVILNISFCFIVPFPSSFLFSLFLIDTIIKHAISHNATRRLFHAKDTPPREVTHRRGQTASRSNSTSPYRSPTAAFQPDGIPYAKTGPPPPRRPVLLSPDKYQILVDRLTYEYKDNNIRREIAM